MIRSHVRANTIAARRFNLAGSSEGISPVSVGIRRYSLMAKLLPRKIARVRRAVATSSRRFCRDESR